MRPILIHMSYVYDETGALAKVLFQQQTEAEPEHHWYAVGTRILFIQLT